MSWPAAQLFKCLFPENIVSHEILKVILWLQQIPFNDLAGQTLVLQVFDFDRFGKHDVIGEIKIPMNSIDLGQPIHEWKDLDGGEKEEVGSAAHLYI